MVLDTSVTHCEAVALSRNRKLVAVHRPRNDSGLSPIDKMLLALQSRGAGWAEKIEIVRDLGEAGAGLTRVKRLGLIGAAESNDNVQLAIIGVIETAGTSVGRTREANKLGVEALRLIGGKDAAKSDKVALAAQIGVKKLSRKLQQATQAP